MTKRQRNAAARKIETSLRAQLRVDRQGMRHI